MTGWTEADMPSQAGRTAVVTGTGGLGYETARALAGAGADVILAGRNPDKGTASVAQILALHPKGLICFEPLDLGDLASVAAFAERLAAERPSLDLLVNNAGVMTPPDRRTTKDGFELQFGTNYLGHFALTRHLLPLLRRGRNPRVVTVSSGAHHTGAINFDDLQWTGRYRPWLAYSQSKLANLMFAFELQRRSDAAGWGLISNAAHPGYARTELIPNGPGNDALATKIGKIFQPLMSQTPAEGALPQLFAATAADAAPSGYYGPRNLFELVGPPVPARVARQAKDVAVAARLWTVSEQLTGLPICGA
jgi:NAD(P)-dependent dehydrogenase (short-subunit alcohol dehydrogenase family)